MKPRDKKMLDVGRTMTDLITFEKKRESLPVDDLHDFTQYIKIFGEVSTYRTKLVNQARAENTKKYIVVRVRSRDDLEETMQMIVKKEKYHIESIEPLSQENLYLEITGYRYMNDMVGSV